MLTECLVAKVFQVLRLHRKGRSSQCPSPYCKRNPSTGCLKERLSAFPNPTVHHGAASPFTNVTKQVAVAQHQSPIVVTRHQSPIVVPRHQLASSGGSASVPVRQHPAHVAKGIHAAVHVTKEFVKRMPWILIISGASVLHVPQV